LAYPEEERDRQKVCFFFSVDLQLSSAFRAFSVKLESDHILMPTGGSRQKHVKWPCQSDGTTTFATNTFTLERRLNRQRAHAMPTKKCDKV
jgi:hypothetical protein